MITHSASNFGLVLLCIATHTHPGLLGAQDAEAVIRVVFRVYGSTSSGTARIRLHTSDHSWVEVEPTTSAG